MVKEATEKSDWKKLHFLFLGTRSSRGIAFECDASFVPLDLLIAEYDTEDVDKLAGHLLLQGAPPDGLRDRKYPPLLVAMEMMKFRVAVTLLRNNADPCCIVGSDVFINREVHTFSSYSSYSTLYTRSLFEENIQYVKRKITNGARGPHWGILASLSTRLFYQHGCQKAEEKLGLTPACAT